MKTSTTQFKVIVDFMERYGDLSKSQPGLQYRLECMKKWQMLSNALNRDPTGDRRSIEKWKKVWSDFKNNTKRKRTKIQKYASLPEHLRPKLTLNDLEHRVLSIVDQGNPPMEEKPDVGVEIQYMETPHQEEMIPAPTVQFMTPEQNSETFHAEGMSEGNHSENYSSSEESSDESSDESNESERLSSPRSRRRNNHRGYNRRSKGSRGARGDPFEASDDRWRKLFSELTSEHVKLRKRELKQQERWHDLFERCLSCVEKFMNNSPKKDAVSDCN